MCAPAAPSRRQSLYAEAYSNPNSKAGLGVKWAKVNPKGINSMGFFSPMTGFGRTPNSTINSEYNAYVASRRPAPAPAPAPAPQPTPAPAPVVPAAPAAPSVPGAMAAALDQSPLANYNFSFSSNLGRFNKQGHDRLAETNPAQLNNTLTKNAQSSSFRYIS